MQKAVVLTGGGIAAAALAGRYARDHHVVLLHVDHGQPCAKCERNAIRQLATTWETAQVVMVDCPAETQLAAQGQPPDAPGIQTPISSVVQRGLMPVLLAIGIQGALRHGAGTLAVGLARVDEPSRGGSSGIETTQQRHREFVHTFNLLTELWLPEGHPVAIQAPLLDLAPGEIVKLGQRLNVPFEHTWSCHTGGQAHCGRCPGCQSRVNMFGHAEAPDPMAALPMP